MKQFIILILFVTYIFESYDSEAKNIVQMIPEGKPYHLKKSVTQKKLITLGWIEHSCIGNTGLKLKAKLDTGAMTSSVNADIIKTVTRGNDRFIFYRIVDKSSKSDVIESKITRYTLIKTKRANGKNIRRPVVMTEFKVGNQIIRDEVNLAQRNHFSYPLLIGRNVLKNNFLIDASRKYTTRTYCD